MRGRVALVTGAGRGIGAATCRTLVESGWSVVALDRASDDPRLPYRLATPDDLSAVAAECEAIRAGSCRTVTGDATDPDTVLGAVRLATETFGRLDASIGAAGVIAGGVPLWEMPETELDAVLEVNLGGIITLAQVSIPVLLAAPEPRAGRFIAVASSAGTRGLELLAAYSAAKAGVAGLVRSLAYELRASGVTATALSPGSTDTDILGESARLYGLADAAEFVAHQPLGRLLEAAEIARIVAFVAGDDGAAFNGAVLAADGGMTA